MIGLLLKKWKLIFDILLVVALVILLFIWNPLGIFGGGLTLQPTANMVTKVREIGQLVTSEYYGEVIASIDEAAINYLEEEQIADNASLLFDRLYEAMIYLHSVEDQSPEVKEASLGFFRSIVGRKKTLRNEISRRNILDQLNAHDLLDDFSSQPLYGDMLEYIWSREIKNKKWKGNSKNKEEALMLVYTSIPQQNKQLFEETSFTDFFYRKKESNLDRKQARKKLAMLGRGWVKAGFDFTKIDQTNFYINEEAGELHFFGLSASILDSDINPWFIPELGIPGFEILDYNGKVDFKDAKKVKQYCIEKLVVKAQQAEILKYAERSGAEILKNLFSLMTGKTIKKVFFHNEAIIQLSQEIAEDEYVNYFEAVLLDSQVTAERKMIDSLRRTRENSFKNKQMAQHRQENIQSLFDLLYTLPFEDVPGNFNAHSLFAYRIAEDSLLDTDEKKQLTDLRSATTITQPEVKAHPMDVSYGKHLLHTTLYNDILIFLLNKRVSAGNLVDSTISKSAFNEAFISENSVIKYEYAGTDSLKAILFLKEATANQTIQDLMHPFNYDKTFFENIFHQENLVLDSLTLDQLHSISMTDSTTLVYDGNSSPHFKLLNLPVSQLIEPVFLEKYLTKEPLWIAHNLAIVSEHLTMDALNIPHSTIFTAQQTQEMEVYYGYLMGRYWGYKSKGPVVRANDWMQDKLDNNSSVNEWLSRVKSKLAQRID